MTVPRILATLFVVAALVLAPAAVHAADAPVEYSTDGVSWSASPPASVFPSTWVPVPGSSIASTLYVRSVRPGNMVVGVYAANAASSDRDLLTAARVTGAGGTGFSLAELGSCSALSAQTVLAEGHVLAVPLTLALAADLTGGQRATLGLDLLIDLSDTGVPTLSNGCPVDPEIVAAFPGPAAVQSPAPLPSTGAAFPVVPLVAALALLAGGVAALFARRRRS